MIVFLVHKVSQGEECSHSVDRKLRSEKAQQGLYSTAVIEVLLVVGSFGKIVKHSQYFKYQAASPGKFVVFVFSTCKRILKYAKTEL